MLLKVLDLSLISLPVSTWINVIQISWRGKNYHVVVYLHSSKTFFGFTWQENVCYLLCVLEVFNCRLGLAENTIINV